MAVRFVYLIAASLLTLCVVIITRTIQFSFPKTVHKPCQASDDDFIHADDNVLGRFSQAIRFRTIARGDGDYDRQELLKLQNFLLKEFSFTFSHPLVSYDIIANYSILLHVKGSDAALRPYLIASHLDVVPASNESWEVPPFEGRIKDGYIWGRGTLDVKNGVMASLEALQFLLKRGHKPKRSFYLAYGHDEEVGGNDGAKQIAATLRSKKVQLEFLVDEGTIIVRDTFPGVKSPYALVGVAEKGYMIVELSVTTLGGHSSMPPRETSIGILAQAIARLESCPMPAILDSGGPIQGLFEEVAPKAALPLRLIIANLWLFKFFFTRVLSSKPSTNAMIRTTTAVTGFNAGIKVVEHDRYCINDKRVNIRLARHTLPSPVSPWDKSAFGYQVVSESIRQVFPEATVAPGLMIAGTDTTHYLDLTKSVYRFLPSLLGPEDLKRFHGFNERISVKNYEQTINYFYHLMVNADKTPQEQRPKVEL
ncbi:N-fatty-acyl-amino acid synthase/hydrolase PM20D1.2-like isoform X2 [Actinia tenebrosa]|uniref:N-fatty-acyl-amino acid synthase/hydrolase PM20D1.2-like isoform X2 n=1 Tax=Actinia tenebrosa TaxID=6105 RepID=A0A6P8IHQ5_ACTTE|nr:N-fatty-acyl-amino acid synthase/hydrolase PM20D1.2-like isoform X2 [Actinia tenebrosa]